MKARDEFQTIVERYDIEWCNSYGEPGYSDPEKGILFADWNDVPQELGDALEQEGYSLEWSDEWLISYETNKAYRQSPDCYAWTPYFVLTDDGDVIGGDEIESGDQAEWYVNEYLLNDANHANVFRGLDLAKYGFRLAYSDGFETGFHPGQNDDPSKILKRINKEIPKHDVVFSITGKGQFDVSWQAWVRPV